MASNEMNIILFLLLIKNGLDPQGTPFGGTRPLAPPAEARHRSFLCPGRN